MPIKSIDWLTKRVALVQGCYFLITGIWPLVSMRSFEAISGRKTDKWLVKTVGGLVAVVGAILLKSAGRRDDVTELAVASAACLGVVDIVYASRRIIAAVYLLDALAEMLFIAFWLAPGVRSQPSHELRPAVSTRPVKPSSELGQTLVR